MKDIDNVIEFINKDLPSMYADYMFDRFLVTFCSVDKKTISKRNLFPKGSINFHKHIVLHKNMQEEGKNDFEKILSFLEKYIIFTPDMFFSSNYKIYDEYLKKVKYGKNLKSKIIKAINNKSNLDLYLTKEGYFYIGEEFFEEFQKYLLSIKGEISSTTFSHIMNSFPDKETRNQINFAIVSFTKKIMIRNAF
jgi:hypothetical protein